MPRTRKGLLITALVVVALAVSASVGYAARSAGSKDGLVAATRHDTAPAITGSCITPRADFATHEDQNVTDSTVFVDIPSATVTFTQHGAAPDCIIVNFTSMSWSSGDEVIVRALLDGTTPGTPNETQFSGVDGLIARSHSMDFVFTSVTPGVHTIQMQYRSATGLDAYIHRGVTTVNHR